MARAQRPLIGLAWLSTLVLVCACTRIVPAPNVAASSSSGVHSGARAAAYHTVRKGDTLYSIAWRHGVDYRKVAYWNGIRAPYTIYPGQRIRLLKVGAARAPRPSRRIASPTTSAGAAGPAGSSKSSRQATIKSSSEPESGSSRARVVEDSRATKRTASAPARVESAVDRWVWPTKGKVIASFGQSGQKGINISGVSGQPIRATAGGRVVYSGGGLIGYGKLIIVKHNKRYLSAYAHNHDVFVKEGDRVQIGQRIATMGSTGTDRVKLHFEIRRDGKPVNPLRYLPR